MKKTLKTLLIAVMIVPCVLIFTACGRYDKGYEEGYQKGAEDALLPSLETPGSISLQSFASYGESFYITNGLQVRFNKVANAIAYNIKLQETGSYDAKYYQVQQPTGSSTYVYCEISNYELRTEDFSVTVRAISDGINYQASAESQEVNGTKLKTTSSTSGSWSSGGSIVDSQIEFHWSESYDFPEADSLIFAVRVFSEAQFNSGSANNYLGEHNYTLDVTDKGMIIDFHSTSDFNLHLYTGRILVSASLYSVGEGFICSYPIHFPGGWIDLTPED